ncbi:hypothetical protein T07_11520, partial [Trichinella nelsoni]
LRHGDVTGVLELECRPSTVGGSFGVRVTRIFGVGLNGLSCTSKTFPGNLAPNFDFILAKH